MDRNLRGLPRPPRHPGGALLLARLSAGLGGWEHVVALVEAQLGFRQLVWELNSDGAALLHATE